jgi:NADP-dependent 3-hydroxy acid dehydrogenase YdfG
MSATTRGAALITGASAGIGAVYADLPLSFNGAPASAWAFRIRRWVAVVVGLLDSRRTELRRRAIGA